MCKLLGIKVAFISCLGLLPLSTPLAAEVSLKEDALTSNRGHESSALLNVKVTNVDNQNGTIRIAIFNEATAWLSKATLKANFKVNSVNCAKGTCNWSFQAPFGDYGVAVYHDVNNNNMFDTNMLGLPKEDYGFSNNVSGFMGPPKWNKAKFVVDKSSITQTIALR